MTTISLHTIEPFKAPDKSGTLRTVTHQPQEIPLDVDQSRHRFELCAEKIVLTTASVERELGGVIALQCLLRLSMFAKLQQGLDYLQVFKVEGSPENLWVIEDGEAITALLPSDY